MPSPGDAITFCAVTLPYGAAAKIAALSEVYDAKGSAAQALADAKTYDATYTDALFNSIGFASKSDIDTIFA